MSIDATTAKAIDFEEFSVEVERGQLRSFAHAIGETDPVFTDLDAAYAAGHPDLPAPPTYLFSIGLQASDPFSYLNTLDIDLRHILHGGQQFDYHATIHAGDSVKVSEKIIDVYSKRSGALEFLVKRTDYRRSEELVATATSTIVVRHPQGATP